jgi:hypothetical protein
MSQIVRKNEEQKEFSLGMIFMAFLMGVATLSGIWAFPKLIKMVANIVS